MWGGERNCDWLGEGLETWYRNNNQNLMETLKLTLGQAMEALKVPGAEKAKYVGMLKG